MLQFAYGTDDLGSFCDALLDELRRHDEPSIERRLGLAGELHDLGIVGHREERAAFRNAFLLDREILGGIEFDWFLRSRRDSR